MMTFSFCVILSAELSLLEWLFLLFFPKILFILCACYICVELHWNEIQTSNTTEHTLLWKTISFQAPHHPALPGIALPWCFCFSCKKGFNPWSRIKPVVSNMGCCQTESPDSAFALPFALPALVHLQHGLMLFLSLCRGMWLMNMQPCKLDGKKHLEKQSRRQPSHAPTAMFQ